MAVIRRVWWSETRAGQETQGEGSKADTEVTVSLSRYYLFSGEDEGKPCVPLCHHLSSWSVWLAGIKCFFIWVIENKRPGPALGWTAGHHVNNFLLAQRGSGGREAWQIWRRDLSSTTQWFTSICQSLKAKIVISTFQTSSQDLLDFPQFSAPLLARRSSSASSLYFVKPPAAPIVLLTLAVALKHDCRVAIAPPSAWLPLRRGCYEHVVGLGEHTHWHACTSAVRGCVKCVNHQDVDLDLTLLCLEISQRLDFSVVGLKTFQTSDLLIWTLTSKV